MNFLSFSGPLLLPLLSLAACSTVSVGGASEDGGRGDASADGAQAATQETLVCESYASYATCDDGGTSATPCSDEAKCFGRLMAPSAAQAFVACHSAPSCIGEDECIAKAGEAAGGQAARDFASECYSKRATCGTGQIANDYCGAGAYAYGAELGPALRACLAKTCAEVQPCFAAAAAAAGLTGCRGK